MSTADPPLSLCVCTACYGETFTFMLYRNPPAATYTKVSCFEMIRRDVCSRPLCWQLFPQLCAMTQPCMEAGRGGALEVHVKPSFCTLLRPGNTGPAPATLNLGKRWRWIETIATPPLHRRGKSPGYPLTPRLSAPQNRYEHFLPLPGIDSLVQPA